MSLNSPSNRAATTEKRRTSVVLKSSFFLNSVEQAMNFKFLSANITSSRDLGKEVKALTINKRNKKTPQKSDP